MAAAAGDDRAMGASSAIRQALTDPECRGSVADRTRRQRRDRLLQAFPDLERMTVLDLGGAAGFWRHMQLHPAHLTLVNIVDLGGGGGGCRMIIGDACDPPPEALDRTYDLVLCNSVIDQVGNYRRREQLADVIRAAAPRYWVQAANRSFPLDAYFMFPWFTRLPIEARIAVVRRWPLMRSRTIDPVEAVKRVLAIEPQTADDLRLLFPDARLIVERFLGLPKSLIAVRA
jgi:hypothetical protein